MEGCAVVTDGFEPFGALPLSLLLPLDLFDLDRDRLL